MNVVRAVRRCPWPIADDPLYLRYHDQEWGVPVHADRKIYEFLVLETFQAGLSWRTVLHKREQFRRAFAEFQFAQVAQFGPREVARLLTDAGIIRNRAKIQAAITNARRLMDVRREFGTFNAYMWPWIGGQPRLHRLRTAADYQPYTPEAVAWAGDLKRRGFAFLGPTVVYAHMQAVGMVNDHVVGCFRYRQLASPSTMRPASATLSRQLRLREGRPDARKRAEPGTQQRPERAELPTRAHGTINLT